jgi:hypothetical protein
VNVPPPLPPIFSSYLLHRGLKGSLKQVGIELETIEVFCAQESPHFQL